MVIWRNQINNTIENKSDDLKICFKSLKVGKGNCYKVKQHTITFLDFPFKAWFSLFAFISINDLGKLKKIKIRLKTCTKYITRLILMY
jgi:hypothetical protein